jgi:hypothetical protein
MHLSERERITLLTMRGYGDNVRSYEAVAALFNNTFPNRLPITKSTVQRTVARFEQTGSVKDRPRAGRSKTASNDDKNIEVLQSFVENPHTSIRKTSQQCDISKSTVQTTLKKYNYHPFKIRLVQELSENDYNKRMEFCEEMMRRFDGDNNFFNWIVFSDEATFELHGSVNRHNCRYWSDENPHWMRDSHTQYPQKLNVWAGILGNTIIGPFFLNENINAERYLHLLQNQILPAIQNVVGVAFNSVWFQQDGAPPHFGINVRRFLNDTFPRKWIGRRGAIEWPPRSPDLNPLDYFFWGHLKNLVFATKPTNLNELRNRILDTVASITPENLQNVRRNFYERLAHCQTVHGRQFEHLLN